MTIAFDVMLKLALRIGDTFSGTATGGSTSTLIDTSCTKPDNYFNNGTLFITDGNNDNKAFLIQDWDLATTKFTFATVSGACAAGNPYIACTATYSKAMLINAINMALMDMGAVLQKDTSLVGTGARRYALPTGVTDIRRIEVEDYVDHYHMIEDGYITFDAGHLPGSGSAITVYHMAPHDEVTDEISVINQLIPLDLIVKCAVPEAYMLRYGTTRSDDKLIAQMISDARTLALQSKAQYLKNFNWPPDSHWASFF